MSAVVEDLKVDLCPWVFVDVMFLFGIFVEMDLRCWIIFGLCRLVSHVNNLITQKFASTSNLPLTLYKVEKEQ
jgi:hypothetical protein